LGEIIRKEERVAEQIVKLINFTRDYKDVGVQPPAWIDIAATIGTIRKSTDLGTVALLVDAEGIEVYADPLIMKVFSNLIDNSLMSGGTVTAIRINARDDGDHLTLLYEDNGAGICAGEKEKIFDRQYETATGLRLFLAREILAITGITIAETGNEGEGVRFEITVPRGDYRIAAPR
jgi:signal transduction histidine kinase